MLRSLTLSNFKSIDESTIDLGRITVLVGPNNAGKSSVLQGLQFVVSLAQSLKLSGATRRVGATSGTLSTQQLVYTPLRDVHALARGGHLGQEGTGRVINVTLAGDEGDAKFNVARGKNRNIAVKIEGDLGPHLSDLENPFSVVSPGLAGIPAYEEFRSPGMVRRAAARGDANSVFRNVLWALRKDEGAWAAFHEALHEVFPDVDIEVSFTEESDEFINATARREGVVLPIDSCGTGILQAVQVLAYVGLYAPKVLILDEPDSHLHPDNQRKLARLLDKLTRERDFQVVMSTHSRSFMDELHAADANIVWFSSGSAQPGEFDRIQTLMDLGALDAADRLNHGTMPVIVLTEDTKLGPLRKVLESSGLTPGDYDVWSYATSSQTKSAIALAKFIHDKAPETRVVVHRDRDYLSEPEVSAFIADIAAVGATPFVTTGTDIESYYLDLDHLATVFPELTPSEIEDIIARATSAARDESIKIMINARVEAANRQRRVGALPEPPSPGSIAAQATIDFDADPARYRHGKTTLKRTRQLLVDEHTLSREIIRTSPPLSQPIL